MNKLYNGFNNGRDKSDGVGGREVNHGTQETMTKEQILDKCRTKKEYQMYVHEEDAIDAMEEHSQQQLSAERERAGKLVEVVEKLSKMGPTWNLFGLVDEAKQTLKEYNENH